MATLGGPFKQYLVPSSFELFYIKQPRLSNIRLHCRAVCRVSRRELPIGVKFCEVTRSMDVVDCPLRFLYRHYDVITFRAFIPT